MDQPRFDALTRSLGGPPSRRRLLGGLAGASLGLGLGAGRLSQDAAAKRKSKNKGKGKDNHEKGNRKELCKRNGQKCAKPGNNCKKQ